MKDSFLAEELNSIYKNLSDLGEGLSLLNTHSERWTELFNLLAAKTHETAEAKWPEQCVIILTKENYSKAESFKFTSLNFTPLDYKKITEKILKTYNPQKTSEAGGKKRPVSFFEYFIFILRNDIFKRYTEIKTELANRDRAFRLSVRQQRKINRLISIIKGEKKDFKITSSEATDFLTELFFCEPPDSPLSRLKNKKNIEFFKRLLQKDKPFFKDKKELQKLLRLNEQSFGFNPRDKNMLIEESEDESGQNKIEKLLTQIEAPDFIKNFVAELDKCYMQKMQLKKQSAENQKKKEEFEKDIITCYYLKKILKTFSSVEFDEIISLIETKSFASKTVTAFFIQRQNLLNTLISSGDSRKTKNIKSFSNNSLISLEVISVNHGKQKNYGTRRITDFRKFFRQMVSETTENEVFLNFI